MASYSAAAAAAALRPPGLSNSNPPSPRISPTSSAPFSFPSSTATSSSSSAAPTPPPIPSSSSSSRFNAAFSSSAFNGSSTRHAPHSSISSLASEDDPSSLRFLASRAAGVDDYDDDLDSPTATTASRSATGFDALQRELGAPEGARGLGLTEGEGMSSQGRGFGGGFPSTREMGRLFEEPEEYDTVRGMSNGRGRGGEDDAPFRPEASTSSRFGAGGGGAGGDHDASDLGRPASIALDANDNSMSFLLSPPPSFDPTTASAKQFAAAAAAADQPKQQQQQQQQQREKERTGRERIFPAPLLLKGDRSFSVSGAERNGAPAGAGATAGPSSPVFPPVQPLSIPRRPSATAGSAAFPQSASTMTSPAQTYQRSWAPRDRGGERGEREGPMNPPDGSHSRLAYHRRQQSSTSSLSHGSYLPYNSNSYSYAAAYEPRHQATASTSTSSTASPSVGSGRNTQAFPTPSTSTSAFPSTAVHAPSSSTASASTTAASASSSPDPPISAQALLLHILALRSASSPMALSQSQGPLSRAGTPLYSATSSASGLANHQRIRSASSTTSAADPDGAGSTISISSALTGADDRARSPSRAGARLDTVDLSHKRIADVPAEVVDELRDEVEKLALGYNLLKDLPPYFSGLGGRLKYLNVRVNMLTTFPAVLCEMPSIEILDISRNKIRKLPQNPGTLLNLKVFSIAKNRIKRLPVWFTSMSHLKVLKLDHNPLEWPPREVATFTASISGQPMSKQEEADEMQRWLPALMKWMKENREREVERERAREVEKRRRPSLAIEHISEDERGPVDERRPAGMTRTESGRLNESLTRSTRTTPALPPVDLPPVTEDASSDPRLDPSLRHSRNASHSTTQSLAPSPRPGLRGKKSLPDLRQSHADILAERRTGTTLEEEPPQPVVPSLEGPLRRLQEEKHPGLVHSSSARAGLPTQASAPVTSAPSPAPPSADTIVRSMSARPGQTSSPPAPQPRQGTAPLPHQPHPPRPKLDLDTSSALKSKRGEGGAAAGGAGGDFDRNSGAYFRRLSMLPVSTISKAVPAALLQFADAIRGILFSLSQIYTALRQFVVFASQDRLPAPVARLMGTADIAMSALINALDRFDSLSRRGTPPQGIVRDVFMACKDNVTVFGKLVGALQPQLKALTATADARYTRTLLLMLYGSMGEIATSWSAVAPFFAGDDSSSTATLMVQPPTPSPQLEKASTTSPPDGGSGNGPRLTRQRSTTRRHAGSFSVEDVQLGAVLPPADIPPVPALPFAMEDGGLSTTPSEFNAATLRARPPLSAKSSAASATSSSGSFSGRAPPPGSLAMPPQLGYEEMAQKAFEHPVTPGVQGLFDRNGAESRAPSRAGSFSAPSGPLGLSTMSSSSSIGGGAGGFPASSSTSSSTSTAVPPLPSMPPPQSIYRSHRESRPVSTLNADETFIDQAESTMAIASDVYGMLLDAFVDDARVAEQFMTISSGRRKLKELTALCEAGNEVTARLGRAVERIRGSDGRGRLKFLQTDATELGTAAFEYVQNVIRTAKLMKAVSQELAFPQPLKDAVGQLTLGTREFARLLSHGHTSFRPQSQRAGGAGGGGAALGMGGAGGAGAGPPLESLPEVRSRDFA
ncbi:hypothetical protein JCM6882_008045 [Rhodosporidiobolus microsporus]